MLILVAFVANRGSPEMLGSGILDHAPPAQSLHLRNQEPNHSVPIENTLVSKFRILNTCIHPVP